MHMKDEVSGNSLTNSPEDVPQAAEQDRVALPPLEQLPIREILLGGIGFILFLVIVAVIFQSVGVETIQRMIRDAGPLGPLVYIAVKAVTYMLAPLTSGPIQVVAGPAFGNLWLAVLYTLIGEVIGGSASFWIARRFGRPMVVRVVGVRAMVQIEDFYHRRMGGWIALAAARLILFSVWDFLSYAAGLAPRVRYVTYLFVSIFFGFFPTFVFVWLGNNALQDPRMLALIVALTLVLILIPIAARRQIEAVLEWASRRSE